MTERGGRRERISLRCEKESETALVCSSRTEIGVSAIAPSHKRVA